MSLNIEMHGYTHPTRPQEQLLFYFFTFMTHCEVLLQGSAKNFIFYKHLLKLINLVTHFTKPAC